jgi:hypothetical protein
MGGKSFLLLAGLLSFQVTACGGGSKVTDGAAGPDGATNLDGSMSVDAGDATATTETGGPNTPIDAADGGALPSDPNAPLDLDARLVDQTTAGTGACSGSALGDVLNQIRSAHAHLADYTALVGPIWMDMPRLIFAFAWTEGFRIVFKRGDGDCPAGCISNEYWYFGTDEACAPELVGHYSAVISGSAAQCYVVDGQPLWGFPLPRGPACPRG